MEFRQDNEKLDFIAAQLAQEPVINVISKEEFEKRVTKVFTMIWERLAKSFGPGGAGTFISIFPNYYNTKDGFTIMKNIAFDKKIDQVISDMTLNICSRLNFTVGDGTTSATIATKSTYEKYIEHKDELNQIQVLPRDILKRFEYFKNIILKKIDSMATSIRSDDAEELRRNIEKVVYISSNGNEEITTMIADLYKELKFPAISVALAKDGIMKSSIIDGYKTNVSLTDQIYINNDDNTLLLNGADVVVFDHKIMKETYEKILKPLSEACGQRGRHLICIAPYYDETALTGVIKADLNAEYKRNKDINLVLTVCSKVTGAQRVAIEDLAMLLNTTVITPGIENQIIEALGEENANIYNFFDIDNRQIDGMTVAVVTDPETNRLALTQYKSGVETFDIRDDAKSIEVGYCDNINIGLKESTFSGFYYDEAIYQKHLSVAKSEYEEVRRKCESIGAFSIELTEKQHRLYSLGLKTGLIEVGSTSDISQGYLKDTVDDAVKAAASAYRNGVVLGCNVTLSRAILETQQEVLAKCDGNEIAVGDRLDLIILEVLFDGFCEVYRTILKNVFEDVPIDEVPWDKFPSYPKTILENKEYVTSLHDYIIWHSIDNNCVFDLGKYTFNSEVINSAETDKEILKATIDLLSLLITGNQLVLC